LNRELKDFAHGSWLTAKFLELLAKPIFCHPERSE
jgi:hypothetical protein